MTDLTYWEEGGGRDYPDTLREGHYEVFFEEGVKGKLSRRYAYGWELINPGSFSDEYWVPIPGYEDLYHCSNLGRVKSLARRGHKDRILKPQVDKSGYQRVTLYRNDGGDKKYTHHIVTETFLGTLPDGMERRHLNGNPADPRLENLQYGTSSENNHDVVKHGKNHWANTIECHRGHYRASWNTPAYALIEGWRVCLACNRGLTYFRDHPELDCTAQEITDEYFNDIVRNHFGAHAYI